LLASLDADDILWVLAGERILDLAFTSRRLAQILVLTFLALLAFLCLRLLIND
jgi:hypothetical protein